MKNSETSFRLAGRATLFAAMLSGSSLALAQETAPTIAAPAPEVSAPVPAPIIAPPPVVNTLPQANDSVNAAAAQEAAAEATDRRQAVISRPAPTPRPVIRAAQPASAVAPTVALAPDAADSNVAPIATAANDVAPATVTNEIAPISAIEETTGSQNEAVSNEDLTLVGGIAAALAAIGLGAAFVSRRRRKSVDEDRQPAIAAHRDFVAPAPIKQDPPFQQFAAEPAVASTAAAPAAERIVQPKPVMTSPDVPVTDPLFSRAVVKAPITDPMFAPRKDVEVPITDPMFAHMSEYKGRSSSTSAWAFDDRQPPQNSQRKLAEVEPAE